MEKRPLYVAPAKRTFMIPVRAWMMLAVYKVFWPPHTKIELGKHTVKLEDIYPWPPPEQTTMVDIKPIAVSKNRKAKKTLA